MRHKVTSSSQSRAILTMIGTLQVSGGGHSPLRQRGCSVGTPVQHCDWPLACIGDTVPDLLPLTIPALNKINRSPTYTQFSNINSASFNILDTQDSPQLSNAVQGI